MTKNAKNASHKLELRLKRQGILSIFLALSPLASAQTLLLKESDIFGDLYTVTSASRLKQNLHTSPASVSIINQQMIKASGAQTLTDILTLAPGFQVFYLNTNRQGANYHGFNDQFPNQLEIMINGRSVYLPLLSTVLWHTLGINIDDIDRVEIIRGSNSATQGSNAFVGAVNFITKSPISGDSWKASATIGSMSSTSANLSSSGQLEGMFYRISASSETNDGHHRFRDSHKRNYINNEWTWSPSIKDNININIGYDKGYSHIGYLYDYSNFPTNQHYIARQEYNSNFQHITWTRRLDDSTKLSLQAYRNYLSLHESKPTKNDITTYYLPKSETDRLTLDHIANQLLLNNPDFRGYREHGQTILSDLEIAIENNASVIHSFTGIGIRNDKASSPVLLQSGTASSSRIRLFNSTEIDLAPKLTVNTGLMYEHQSSQVNAVSGRVALNYQIQPETSIRIGYSDSERLPSLLERNGNFSVSGFIDVDRANTSLRPEKNQSYEIGAHHQLEHFNGTIGLRFFRDDISNAIMNYSVKNTSGSVGEKRNIGQWQNTGIEAQFKIKPAINFWALLNYSYLNNKVGSWDQGFDKETFMGGQHAPRHTLSALLNWELKEDLNLSTTYYFIDEVEWRKSYGTLTPMPRYERIDIKVAKVWRGINHQIELATLFQNALHRSQQTFYQDHRFDRRALVQLNIIMD